MPGASLKEGETGALTFAHGYRSTVVGTMDYRGFEALAGRLGIALVAVKSAVNDWMIRNAPRDGKVPGTDEPTYFDRIRGALISCHGHRERPPACQPLLGQGDDGSDAPLSSLVQP